MDNISNSEFQLNKPDVSWLANVTEIKHLGVQIKKFKRPFRPVGSKLQLTRLETATISGLASGAVNAALTQYHARAGCFTAAMDFAALFQREKFRPASQQDGTV